MFYISFKNRLIHRFCSIYSYVPYLPIHCAVQYFFFRKFLYIIYLIIMKVWFLIFNDQHHVIKWNLYCKRINFPRITSVSIHQYTINISNTIKPNQSYKFKEKKIFLKFLKLFNVKINSIIKYSNTWLDVHLLSYKK